MRYCLATIKKAEAYGIEPAFHKKSQDGKCIAVNELELSRIDSDISIAASRLGGVLLTLDEILVEMNNSNIE